MLHIALPNKGALSDAAIALVAEAGYRCARAGRELCMPDTENDVEFFFLRPRDIAVYVSQGVIDVGITGRDLNLDAAAVLDEAHAGGGARQDDIARQQGEGLGAATHGGGRVRESGGLKWPVCRLRPAG